MVGRLAATYCPPLLTTDVVEISRSALVGSTGDAMSEVEAVARVALEAAATAPAHPVPLEDGRP
jgi:hypothetical protein